MKKIVIKFAGLLIAFSGIAQNQDTTYWQRGVKGNVTFTQSSLTNWIAGGESTLALSGSLSFFANYQKDKIKWENTLETAYGFVDQSRSGFTKSDDKIVFVSQLGYELDKNKKWYWSNLLDFKTQFDNGFDPEIDTADVLISKFLAPAYIIVSTGIEWDPTAKFSLLYSLATFKGTIVNDQGLADLGSFGVTPAEFDANGIKITDGQNFRSEVGTYLKASFKDEIVKNVNLNTRLELFTNFLENFGDIDVNWQLLIEMKVNDWLSANLTMDVIYDKDIRFDLFDDSGNLIGDEDRIQFKQIFGVGLSYTMANR